jgi:hypothetical protein
VPRYPSQPSSPTRTSAASRSAWSSWSPWAAARICPARSTPPGTRQSYRPDVYMRQWRVGSLVSSCPRGTQTAHLISTFVDPRLPAAGEDFHRGADAAPCAREQGTWGVLQEVDTVAAERGPSGGQAVRMESEGGSDAGRSWWVARTRARGFRTRTRSRRSSRSPPPAPAAAAAVAILPAPRRGTPQRAPRRTRAKAEAGAAHHLESPG